MRNPGAFKIFTLEARYERYVAFCRERSILPMELDRWRRIVEFDFARQEAS